MKVVSVGDRVEEGAYRLHSRFRHVANFADGTRLVVVAFRSDGSDRSVGSGPVNIVIEGGLPETGAIAVEPGILVLDGRRHPLGPRYDSALPDIPPAPTMVEALANHLRSTAHPKSLVFLLDKARTANFRAGFEQNLLRQIQAGVEKLFGEDPAQGARLLRGCGFGLTPAGDDFLAGVMIGWRLRKGRLPPQPWTAWRTTWKPSLPAGNLLSDAFLDLAAEGRVNGPMKQLVLTLGGRDADRVRAAADRVLAHGETSGADSLTGLVLGMDSGC